MSRPVLYGRYMSSCSWRVRCVLQHKGIDYDYHPINVPIGEHLTPFYLKLNPMGTIPCYVTAQKVVLTQSLAIMEYLEETTSDGSAPNLMPLSPEGRAAVRAICNAVVSGIQPLQNAGVLEKVDADGGKGKAWAKFWIEDGFEGLEVLLKTHSGVFCYGNNLTLADCCVVPQVYNARERYGVDMTRYPTLQRVAMAAEAHPSIHAARPEAQVDAPQK